MNYTAVLLLDVSLAVKLPGEHRCGSLINCQSLLWEPNVLLTIWLSIAVFHTEFSGIRYLASLMATFASPAC